MAFVPLIAASKVFLRIMADSAVRACELAALVLTLAVIINPLAATTFPVLLNGISYARAHSPQRRWRISSNPETERR